MSDGEHRTRAAARPGPYRGERRGWLGNALGPVIGYLITNVVVAPFVLLFFWVLNRTTVYGRRRIPNERNTLLLANHQSMIDSFPIGYSAFYPQDIVKPFLIPWNPAAQENFFRNRFLAWWFHMLKCIPVRPGRRDMKAIYRSIRALQDSTMILFPEGTRSRDGTIGRGRPGAGLVILGTGATVVPVTIDGMERVLPIGSRMPRIGKRVSVYFGKPIHYADLAEGPRSRETAQRIVDRAMARIRFQRRVIARLEGRPRPEEGAPRAGLDSEPPG